MTIDLERMRELAESWANKDESDDADIVRVSEHMGVACEEAMDALKRLEGPLADAIDAFTRIEGLRSEFLSLDSMELGTGKFNRNGPGEKSMKQIPKDTLTTLKALNKLKVVSALNGVRQACRNAVTFHKEHTGKQWGAFGKKAGKAH